MQSNSRPVLNREWCMHADRPNKCSPTNQSLCSLSRSLDPSNGKPLHPGPPQNLYPGLFTFVFWGIISIFHIQILGRLQFSSVICALIESIEIICQLKQTFLLVILHQVESSPSRVVFSSCPTRRGLTFYLFPKMLAFSTMNPINSCSPLSIVDWMLFLQKDRIIWCFNSSESSTFERLFL